jgi:hypothetical protein
MSSKISRYMQSLLGLCLTFILLGDAESQSFRSTVIDERANKEGVRTVISVDQDDVVHEIDIDEDVKSGATKAHMTGNLGIRILKSGDLELAALIPKQKVATAARRVTLPNGIIVHVIIAWGFPDLNTQNVYCSAYAFKEAGGKATLIFSKLDLGTELHQFIVEDINQDGKSEILIATREGHDQTMRIHQIQPDGSVRFIQNVTSSYVHTLADRYMDDEMGIYVEDKSEKSVPGGLCFKTWELKWSEKDQKFIKEDIPQ